eukprot:scaffold5442_cov26-Prasinocladus_malaysianus.AAC.1
MAWRGGRRLLGIEAVRDLWVRMRKQSTPESGYRSIPANTNRSKDRFSMSLCYRPRTWKLKRKATTLQSTCSTC